MTKAAWRQAFYLLLLAVVVFVVFRLAPTAMCAGTCYDGW